MYNTAYTRGLGNLADPPIEEEEQEPRLTAKQLAALTTTRARSETLWQDGYEIHPTTEHMVFDVVTPERLDKKTGEVWQGTYTVDVVGGTCTCPCFAFVGACKHIEASRRRVEEAMAAVRLLTPKAPVELPDESPDDVKDFSQVRALPLPARGSDAYRHQIVRDFG